MGVNSRITNFDDIAITKLRKDALTIIETGLSAVETRSVINSHISFDPNSKTLCIKDEEFCFSNYENIYFVAIGKCAVEASKAVEEILGDEITAGFVLDIIPGQFVKLESLVGTHPLPTEINKDATDSIVSLLKTATDKDLVLVVISGGGSALLCNPFDMSCENLAKINKSLMEAGATIQEVNTVRKHLSMVQGGHLAEIAYPATVIGLIFSDVVGNDVSVIASGPLTRDITTVSDAQKILEKYNIFNLCSLPGCELLETPKDEKFFQKVKTFIIASNETALKAMEGEARRLGYIARIVSTQLVGEAREVGRTLAKSSEMNTALLYGGETTVTVKEQGKGGRNQELVLGALSSIEEDQLLISMATDGRDNSDVAGAIADKVTLEFSKDLGMSPEEYLEKNNSYDFWEKVGSRIITGNTGINVSDVMIVLRK